MNTPLHSNSGFSAFIRQDGIRILTLVNLILAAWFIPQAIYISYMLLSSTSTTAWADFTVYYTAARIIHINPADLYNLGVYQDLFSHIHPISYPKEYLNSPYFCPPALAIVLYPLGYLNFKAAFMVFSLVNIALLAIIAQQIKLYVHHTSIAYLTPFLQSIFISVTPVFVIFLQGQISLITCSLLMGFLLTLRSQKLGLAAFMLALAIHIKPQYFLPLALLLGGYKQWKVFCATIAFGILFMLISTLICGIDIWEQYLHILSFGSTQVNIPMVNLQGILDELLHKHDTTSTFINICYIIVCDYTITEVVFKRTRTITFSTILALTLFFCPYMITHDMVLFLPVVLSIILCLHNHHKLWLLIPLYILAVGGPLIGLYPLRVSWDIIYCYQIVSVFLVIMALYSAYLNRRTFTIPIECDLSRV